MTLYEMTMLEIYTDSQYKQWCFPQHDVIFYGECL